MPPGEAELREFDRAAVERMNNLRKQVVTISAFRPFAMPSLRTLRPLFDGVKGSVSISAIDHALSVLFYAAGAICSQSSAGIGG